MAETLAEIQFLALHGDKLAKQKLALLQHKSMLAAKKAAASTAPIHVAGGALPVAAFAPQVGSTLTTQIAISSPALDAIADAVGDTPTLGACQVGMDCAMQAEPSLAMVASPELAVPTGIIGDTVNFADLSKAAVVVAAFFAAWYFLRRK